MAVEAIAQSNIQLYGQLQRRGYGSTDISDVARAYRLAQQLFSSRFRGSGRPFLCHLVGTASILARDSAPVHEVTAGLLHAAYRAGLFAFDMHQHLSDRKRALVRGVVGSQAEALIAAYHGLSWNHAMLASLADNTTTAQLAVLRLRLANELDDLADNGLLFSGKAKRSLVDSYTLLPPSSRERLSYRLSILRRRIGRRLRRPGLDTGAQ